MRLRYLTERWIGRAWARSWLKISLVRTLSTERLSGRLGRLDDGQMIEIVEGLQKLIG